MIIIVKIIGVFLLLYFFFGFVVCIFKFNVKLKNKEEKMCVIMYDHELARKSLKESETG